MKQFQVAYIPIGVPTFHLESAQEQFEQSIVLLRSVTEQAVVPEKMLLTIDDLKNYLDTIEPELIVLQNITFANAAYANEVLMRFQCPILLWTLREPVIDGGRLRLNSLTGAYSAANAIREFGRASFEYLYGAPQEAPVKKKIADTIAAAKLLHSLSQLKLAAVGHTPQGFGFGRALDGDLMKVFGVTLEAVEARELIDRARSYSEEECADCLEELRECSTALDETPRENLIGFSRIYKAYKEYVTEQGIGALASRCWPDFFTAYGTPVCAVLGMLNDMGIAASCEADVYGALSMYIGMQLTGKAVFFGDPVSLDEQENTITYWHCGTAACSLARNDTGAVIGVHPNRKIGPVMDFGCKPCAAVTLLRVGRKPDGTFRIFLAEGKALDKPKQFCGTSVVVEMKGNAGDIVSRSVKDGWEPHFVVIYASVPDQLEIIGSMLNIEVCRY